MTEEIIGKYLAGEASPEEAVALEDWLGQSPHNREAFERLSQLWFAASGSAGHQLPDKTKLAGEIKEQLSKVAGPKTITRGGFKRPYVFVAAASVVILTTIILLTYKGSSPKAPVVTTMSFTTNEGIQRDTLANGSIVILNSHSSVQLKSDNERELEQGQIYVIAPPAGSITVKADDVSITATDAAFGISKSKPSGDITIWGKKGTVQVQKADGLQTVAPGSRLTYYSAARKWERDTAYAANEIGFATRIFNFQDEKLSDIMQQIGKAYEVEVQFQNQQLKECRMSGGFEDQSLKYVMDIIAATLQIQYRLEKNKVVINGTACE